MFVGYCGSIALVVGLPKLRNNLEMKKIAIAVTLILSSLMSCNMISWKHKDHKIKLKDFDWNIRIEGCGEIYVKGSNFIYGRNYDSTFIEISSTNGAILDTLHPYTVEKERDCLILDKASVYGNGYLLHYVNVDQQKYAKVTLKAYDRQYRGDDETYFLIINTLTNQEFIILFNRKQFSSIHDITHFKEGKFIMIYDGEAGYDQQKYSTHVGLFDLEKIWKK